jgi:hypothetical protein
MIEVRCASLRKENVDRRDVEKKIVKPRWCKSEGNIMIFKVALMYCTLSDGSVESDSRTSAGAERVCVQYLKRIDLKTHAHSVVIFMTFQGTHETSGTAITDREEMDIMCLLSHRPDPQFPLSQGFRINKEPIENRGEADTAHGHELLDNPALRDGASVGRGVELDILRREARPSDGVCGPRLEVVIICDFLMVSAASVGTFEVEGATVFRHIKLLRPHDFAVEGMYFRRPVERTDRTVVELVPRGVVTTEYTL